MAKVIKTQDVIAMMRKRQGAKTDRQFALELGITPAYLSDLYRGNRTPGPKVLEQLGLSKIEGYEIAQ